MCVEALFCQIRPHIYFRSFEINGLDLKLPKHTYEITPEMHQFITFQILVVFLPNKKENQITLMSELASSLQ